MTTIRKSFTRPNIFLDRFVRGWILCFYGLGVVDTREADVDSSLIGGNDAWPVVIGRLICERLVTLSVEDA